MTLGKFSAPPVEWDGHHGQPIRNANDLCAKHATGLELVWDEGLKDPPDRGSPPNMVSTKAVGPILVFQPYHPTRESVTRIHPLGVELSPRIEVTVYRQPAQLSVFDSQK